MPRDATPTEALPLGDLALVHAIRSWSEVGIRQRSSKPPHLLRWFGADLRARLEVAWDALGRTTPESAWQSLLAEQVATHRFDPLHVHPSWFVRLFEAESPPVQWVVAQTAIEPIRTLLRERFAERLRALDPEDGLLRAVGPANPVAVSLAGTYWTERLVGDRSASPHDPPVIVALTQLRSGALVRLLRAMGQAKQAFGLRTLGPSAADEEQARCRPSDRVRVAYFRRTLRRVDPRLAEPARRDFAAVTASPRRRYAAVGLISVARLLREVNPHRARWAVQHLPYGVARSLAALGRSESRSLDLSRRAVVAWESWIIEAAWARLLHEGRLGIAPGPEASS